MTNHSESQPQAPPPAPDLSVEAVAAMMEKGVVFQIMDTRSPERVAQGRLCPVPDDRYHNIPGSELANLNGITETDLDPALPLVVICGHGKDSRVLAAHLRTLGLEASSLSGGLAAWMNHTVPRVLDPPEGVDHLIQFDRLGKGSLGYLLVSGQEAIIVDPPLDYAAYVKTMEGLGARLVGVLDTHVHADYVSGTQGLSRDLSVPYYLHPADAIYPYDGTPGKIEYQPIEEGHRIEFGKSALEVVHTPGHTEGSVTLLLEGRVAFTGDFLFVESLGRPDLGGKEEEWTDALWTSTARAIRDFPDGVAIYPAHYASERERRMGRAVGIPFGTLLRESRFLKIQDPEVFRWEVLGKKAPFPEAYKRIKAMNLGLEPIVESEVEVLEVGRNECALGGT